MSIDVLIADDQALMRAGFRTILETDPDLRIVAEANDGAQAVDAARRTRPDIVLMDIRMPVMDGLEATRRIVATTDPPRVLILTTFDLDEYVYDALAAGASGFLLKDVAPEQLIAGIHIIAQGDSLLSPTVTRRLIESFVHSRSASAPQAWRARPRRFRRRVRLPVPSPGPSNSSPSPRARQEHHHRRMTCGLCSSLDADVLRRRRSMRNSDAPTRRDSRAAVSQ
jgi:DNA-binding NarL/FixJ family response regulator